MTLYVDYSAPVQELRELFHKVLEESALWDGKAWAFQVTDTGPQVLQLRGIADRWIGRVIRVFGALYGAQTAGCGRFVGCNSCINRMFTYLE